MEKPGDNKTPKLTPINQTPTGEMLVLDRYTAVKYLRPCKTMVGWSFIMMANEKVITVDNDRLRVGGEGD